MLGTLNLIVPPISPSPLFFLNRLSNLHPSPPLTGDSVLDHVSERELELHLLQFSEVVEEACTNLLPNVLCEYLYNLSEICTKMFYSNCQVLGSAEETSRLLLCEATAMVMRKRFNLLGITPVFQI